MSALCLCLFGEVTAFAPSSAWTSTSARHTAQQQTNSRHVEVRGMFDGIKDAFSAEDADMAIDQDRETPFDRWMGISTKATAERKKSMSAFVDSMADENYMKVRRPWNKVVALIPRGAWWLEETTFFLP